MEHMQWFGFFLYTTEFCFAVCQCVSELNITELWRGLFCCVIFFSFVFLFCRIVIKFSFLYLFLSVVIDFLNCVFLFCHRLIHFGVYCTRCLFILYILPISNVMGKYWECENVRFVASYSWVGKILLLTGRLWWLRATE